MTEHSPWHLLHVMQRLAAERAAAQHKTDRDGATGGNDHQADGRKVDNGHTDVESGQIACHQGSLARVQSAEHDRPGHDGGDGQAPSATGELELTGCQDSRPNSEVASSRNGAEYSGGHPDVGPVASTAQSEHQSAPSPAASKQTHETTSQQHQRIRPASAPADGGPESRSSQGHRGVWHPVRRTAPNGDLADMV